MNILVTGGCGYIGHYAVEELIKSNYNVIVVDDLSSGYEEGLHKDAKFYKTDITDYAELKKIFKENKIDLIMDFAAKLIVEESNVNPKEYYKTNVLGVENILDLMVKYNVKNILFSSTAAVYGLLDKKDTLIEEEDITIPSNPYGETKLVGENMIKWYAKAYDIKYVIFRYFNVVGGIKPGGKIEDFTTIVPKIINSINENKVVEVYGGDYNTFDGTCIRDYIHVYDLVEAHVLITNKIKKINSNIFNLSIGCGTSVLELINSASKVLNKKVNYKIVDKREGDPVVSAASNTKIMNVIDWKIKYSNIEMIVKEAYDSWIK